MKLSIVYIIDKIDYQDSLKSYLSRLNKETELLVINRCLAKDDWKKINSLENENVRFFDGYRKTLKECIQLVLKEINGEYTLFSCSSCQIQPKTISKILKSLKNNGKSLLYLDNNLYNMLEKKEVKNFDFNDYCFSISIYSYVFPTSAISLEPVIDICDSETSVQLLLNIFKTDYSVFLIKQSGLFYSDKLWLNHDCYNKNWYTNTINDIYMEFVKKNSLNFRQEGILYCSIFYKFLINKNGSNKEVLLWDERQTFFDAVGNLFRLFSNDFFSKIDILDFACNQDYGYKYLMISFREKINEYKIYFQEGDLYSKINDYSVCFNSNFIGINVINYNNKVLKIDANFPYIQLYDSDSVIFYALVNGEKKEVRKTEIYSLTKYFAISTSKKYTFQLEVPIQNEHTTISFVMKIDDKEHVIPFNFQKVTSRLTNQFSKSYWAYKDILLKHKNNILIIDKKTALKHINAELQFYGDMLLYSNVGYRFKNLLLRTAYWLGKPFYKRKRIWLYFDKLYKADDNGEFAINYSSKLKDGIDHYYVINKDSYDLQRLKKAGIKIIKFNSFHHKLMSLYAENIVATHPDIIKFCGYGETLQLAFRNLFNANIICIAHGLTMQKNAEVQNRIYDNTMFYTTSSKYEVEHLLKPVYGYSKDQVALTGMARFDKMISNNQKQILITPTWRRSVSGVSDFNNPKGYNDEFKESAYYKVYNSLINDSKLIEAAKKKGYRIIFLLHPAMSAQIDDYDKNDYVDFIQATSDICYNKILSEASLMVTDYSGVQYDFAYMHKPIIYYHSDMLPPRFEEGALKYDTMGFGPICKNHDQIVDKLVKYIKNDCRIEKEYDNRINDFFAFSDYENGKRIYEAILEFTERSKQ